MQRRAEGAAPATVLKDLGLLRAMFNVARKQWKWKISNPVSSIKLPKVSNERVRYLFPDEYERLFLVLDAWNVKWLKPLIVIAIDTGLRLSNLCDLKTTDVDLPGRMIMIDAERMKDEDYLGLPLTDGAYETLTELHKVRCLSGHVFHDNGKKLYDCKVQRAFNKALKKAEIKNFHFHDLRHTFGSYLRQKGVDLDTVGRLMGHKDLRMTRRYTHLNVDSLRTAISKLNFTFLSRRGDKKKEGTL